MLAPAVGAAGCRGERPGHALPTLRLHKAHSPMPLNGDSRGAPLALAPTLSFMRMCVHVAFCPASGKGLRPTCGGSQPKPNYGRAL